MLFRAIAPRRAVFDAFAELAENINPFSIAEMVWKIEDPENFFLIASLNVPSDKFDELMKQTQATVASIYRPNGEDRLYDNRDTLWLSDHDGNNPFLSACELDLYITREE